MMTSEERARSLCTVCPDVGGKLDPPCCAVCQPFADAFSELEAQFACVRTLTLEAASLIVEANRRHEAHCTCDFCTQSIRDATAIRAMKEQA